MNLQEDFRSKMDLANKTTDKTRNRRTYIFRMKQRKEIDSSSPVWSQALEQWNLSRKQRSKTKCEFTSRKKREGSKWSVIYHWHLIGCFGEIHGSTTKLHILNTGMIELIHQISSKKHLSGSFIEAGSKNKQINKQKLFKGSEKTSGAHR